MTLLWLRAAAGAWWIFGSRILVAGIWGFVRRTQRSRETRLFYELSAAAIYIATAAVILHSVFALPITGVVATSGVIAIVIGLALQNTLSDVFAGIAVEIEAPFGVGDRIQIGERIEGQVIQVNWRSIRIQTDGDDVAIIPNSSIAKAEIINRSFPTHQRAAAVELSCPQHAAPERVLERLLNATLLSPDILRVPAPTAAMLQLGAKRNHYRISFSVASTSHLTATKDLLLRAARRHLHYTGLLDESETNSQQGSRSNSPTLVIHLLRDMTLFECLNDQQIDKLTRLLEVRVLEPGEQLFAQGAMDTSLYIVADGILEFTRQGDVASRTVGCMGAGEYVGEIGLLTGAPHAATATARTHCRIYCLPRCAIAPLISDNVALAAAFEKSVRHGLDILQGGIAVKVAPSIGTKGQLLRMIRSIFHLHAAGD